jgi:hypothetical protein
MNMVSCNREKCFSNVAGHFCKLLNAGYNEDEECPFFKTDTEVDNGRIEAHNRLVMLKRKDLIEQYEYNPHRRGMW